jgi:very-short-patch-repair endonuclease
VTSPIEDVKQSLQTIGFAFRQNTSVCGYVVDFYSPELELAVDIRKSEPTKMEEMFNQGKDRALNANGYSIIGIPADMTHDEESLDLALYAYISKYLEGRNEHLMSQLPTVPVPLVVIGVFILTIVLIGLLNM